MFIKEAGYIETVCYAKYAGINLNSECYPQAEYTDDEIKNELDKVWNCQDDELERIITMAKKFGLYKTETYFIFLSVLPLWDGRFKEVFSIFGGIDGFPTEILARDMWEKNHKEKAIVRNKFLYGFFIDEGPVLKPKRAVSEFLSGIYKNDNDSQIYEIISPRAQQIFENVKDLDKELLFYGQRGIGKRTCFKLLSEYKGLVPIIIDVNNADEELFWAVVLNRAVAVCDTAIESVVRRYLPYLPLCVWIFEKMPVGFKACSVLFSPLNMEERYNVWIERAKKYDVDKNVNFRILANQYNLSPREIDESFRSADRIRKVKFEKSICQETLYAGVHDVLSHQFESRARRVERIFDWDDLVLPEAQKVKIMECCLQVSLRHIVMEKWELGNVNNYGGTTVLFYGPPGTGKTMASQVIASQLGMELYKAELSAIVSKFVGETEKNLKRIFEDAKKSQAILFFDEADALFGKRTEVKDSHDKYSNMEAAFLLQEMEHYNGIVILATNFVENIDEAFKRRMKFIVEFPFPAYAERRKIWEKTIPSAMPVGDDVDFDFLAEKFEITGSGIKNAVYGAAFLAAAKEKPVGMEEFILAVKREYEKNGKLFSDTEAGVYSAYIKTENKQKD